MPAPTTELWDRLERLVDRAPTTDALRAHGLHLFAARCWREQRRPVPVDLVADERHAAMLAMAAPLVLAHVRAAYDGELMLMKGPEAAACYRDPDTRYYRDLDILADDPGAAQRALVAAGFVEGGDPKTYAHAQHLRPLLWPGLPLVVEVHRRPNCPAWLAAPRSDELLRHRAASRTGVSGLLRPTGAAHALLIAAHSWAHCALGRLADLVDVIAVLGDTDLRRADELAREWGWEGLWQTTIDAAEALLGDQPRPGSLAVWARHLDGARERTVLENHLTRLAAPIWGTPLAGTPRSMTVAVSKVLGRNPGECWGEKLHRSRLALAHAFMEQSEHRRILQTQSKE